MSFFISCAVKFHYAVLKASYMPKAEYTALFEHNNFLFFVYRVLLL